MKYVHAGCLEEWRRLSPRSSSALRCDQCRAPYRFKKSRFVGFGTSPGLVLLVSMLLFGILAYGAGVICELAYSRFDSSVIEAKVEREQLDFKMVDTSHGVRFYVRGEGAGSDTSPRIMTYAQLLRHFRYGDPRQRTAKDAGSFLKFLYEFSADYDTEAAGFIAMAGAWTGVADPDYGKSDKELRKAQEKYSEQRELAAKQGWWSELKWVWLHGEDAPGTASTVSSAPPAPPSARETEPVASVPDHHAQAASSSSPIVARKWYSLLIGNAERPQLEDSVGDQRRFTKLCPTEVQDDAASSRKGAQQGECITTELVKEKLMDDLSKQETWPIRVVTQMLLGLFVIGAGSLLQVLMSLLFTPFGNWGVGRHFARREARNRRGRNGGDGGAMDTVIIVLGVLLILFGILKAAYAVYKAVNSFSRRALGQVEDYLVDWTGEDEDAPRPHRIEQEWAPARAGPVHA
ncbi:Zinc finger, RING/FYVE/PHD-type [Ceraceosorus bombacis]|uniref:Zinc finger, RING/FYVE/PHD-type n=1 Tax=Ceraceosorus bombacis TaxID=401625 RepID=A0A0N7L963_9BASI|nr:Zinc finger, RING/FYVE/PHD-type [Ceraceosorus bombacis]